jgi:glycosyltransferase involved in cell wall biosynthesis
MLRKEKIDLFHGAMAVLPVLSGIPSVLTIHDLALELFPETMHWKNWLPLKLFMKASARKADRIIAVSENTKKDLIKFYGIMPEQVKVIYLGVDKNFSFVKKENDDGVLRRYNLKPGYILNVGTLEPRKNIVRLLEAYRLIAADLSRAPQLVIAGGKGWLSEDINKRIDSLGLKAKVILTGYVPDDDLPSLYRGAALFVYPSLYEGFGLPPLEAMASGVPVVSSNTSAIPEVVGKAGLLVDPCRTDEIARAVIMALEDVGLRDRMKNEGLKRSGRFSWENTAKKTIALYEEVLRGTR